MAESTDDFGVDPELDLALPVVDAGPQPDPVLYALYASERPTVELLPGTGLAPLVNSTWLADDPKAMLQESWMAPSSAAVEPIAAEEEGTTSEEAAPPAFDPAALEYTVMQQRLSKCAAFVQWNSLMVQIQVQDAAISAAEKGDDKESMQLALEALKQQLAEVEVAVAAVKASFYEDPLSLVPWMQTLFDLADAGLTTFDVSGPFWPYTSLRTLFASDNTSSLYEGVEKVLGTFKRRYELERGPNQVQVLARVVPNIFQDAYSPASVESVVDKIRASIYTPEVAEPLDSVQLLWWDLKEVEVLPTLKVLQGLCEDKLEAAGEEGADPVITEPKKIKGLALVDFPAPALLAALQAGVPITAVQVQHSLGDRSNAKALEMAKQYGIKVLARGGLMGGLISEKYLDAACPDPAEPDEDLDSLPHTIDIINNYGGWDKVQELLSTVQKVADKHGVKMQTVALRWQIDQGTFPMVTTRWGPRKWRTFGYSYQAANGTRPGIDAALFQKASFLDASDLTALNALA